MPLGNGMVRVAGPYQNTRIVSVRTVRRGNGNNVLNGKAEGDPTNHWQASTSMGGENAVPHAAQNVVEGQVEGALAMARNVAPTGGRASGNNGSASLRSNGNGR